MRQEITLYLNGQQIDLNDNGGIYFNYKQKDVKNPTIVKNSFSKTLTIPGTDNNDNIFNNIWDLTRVQTTDIVPYFNQSKRVPFELFLNGELIEQGYCKLDRIRRDRVNEYDLSLYGGLGDFFYSLSYDSNTGEKKTLASLDFGQDLGFTINKDTVKANWDELASGQTPTIAFAPCYNGIPDVIDAGKTLAYVSGYTGTIRENSNGTWTEGNFPTNLNNYKTVVGYALTEGEELDEWSHRDLRSYLQRPCLYVPALFEALSNPDNNGGYEVQLDPDFFTSGNNYFNQAYLTLPLITDLDMNKVEETVPISGTVQASVGSSTGETNVRLEFDGGYDKYTIALDLAAMPNGTTATTLYTSQLAYDSEFGSYYIFGGFAAQIIGFDRNGMAVAGSNIVWLSSQVNGKTSSYQDAIKYGIVRGSLYRTNDVVNSVGTFQKTGNVYMWSETGLVFTMETNVKLSSFKLKIVPAYYTPFNIQLNPDYVGKVWDESVIEETNPGYELAFNTVIDSAAGVISEDTVSFSDVFVSKDALLSTQYTPADYLLSYCKLFNLYFDRDVTNKTVKILTSKNFYDKDIDLEDRLDDNDYDEAWKPYGYDRHIEIEPLSFEHKWYSFNYAAGNGPLVKNYKAKYGVDFGSQRVNTGYEFDSDTQELLTSNVFKNAVDYLPSNKYFVQVKDENNVELPIFLLDNVTYHLYNDDLDPTDITMGISRSGSYSSINPKSTETIQYDAFNKVQFCDGNKPTDGANVLLFFNGMKTTPVDYLITDDLGVMFQLNEKATWLWMAVETDAGGNQIAIKTNSLPQFSRYIMDDDYIYASWDFGRTRELYIPEISYVDGDTTIYERYWRAYIQDLYDIDTRIVTAYIQFDEKPTKESLKHFYYFEGSYWVIDEIIDYNPTSYELTKVKFVKVNDKANYLNNNIVPPGPGPEPPVEKVFEFRPDGIMVNAESGSTTTTLFVSGYEVVEWTIPTRSWATITRNGNTITINYQANPDTTNRSIGIGVAGRDGSETVTAIYGFLQKGVVIPDTVSITAPSPIAATATTLTYTVTASKDVRVELLPDHTVNTHGSGSSIGSFTIPANTADTAQYYSLVATLIDNPSISAATSITQDGVSVYVTGISLSSTWATDVPATGGTATYQNCNNVVTAHYSDGTNADITSQASFTASTSLNVSATTATTRESVGVISVIASYYDGPNPFTSTVVVTAYQEAYVPPTPTETWYAESNISTYGIYGNGLYGGDMVCGFEVLPFETEPHTEAVPFTIDELWLGPSPTPPTNSAIIASNSRTSQSIRCDYSTSNNAWIGTGQIDIAQGDTVLFELIQTRGTVQEEPEPDETEETPGTETE